jgi:hypothetical protein
MTREEVIAAARDLMVREGRAVLLEPLAARSMTASAFNELFGRQVYPGDFWTVEFLKVLPPGVAAESPGSVLVEVIPATGEVGEVYVGMYTS